QGACDADRPRAVRRRRAYARLVDKRTHRALPRRQEKNGGLVPQLLRSVSASLVLQERERVLCGIGDPGEEREAGVVDAVLGLEAGIVVLLDLHAARAEIGQLRGEVLHAPLRLSLAVRRACLALADEEPAAAAAAER